MRDQYMRGGEVFVIVYSVTDKHSHKEAGDFYENVLRVKDKNEWPVVFAGNKTDLVDQRTVTTIEGEELAKRCGGAPFFETSAKTATNITEIFHTAIKLVKKMPEPTDNTPVFIFRPTYRVVAQRRPLRVVVDAQSCSIAKPEIHTANANKPQ